ncbi:phosphate ABC transporter permease PstA [Xylocopilactobacillus apicola]|uniref:Phosphate transport system permease protein PstA n=1 Tax=Xylocopilactobacillus apicola TaxID=2932184 RepID=A0AAU9DQ27_9LACO|nr:phosphate ABC transporter permease PstA [Xylocopilactobacillus apicola]BDR57949.1 phosphate transport system permease protein PstA [Xylocopilactobacillus apicola]
MKNGKKVHDSQLSDRIANYVFYAIALVICLILAALLIYILVAGLPHVSWHFLTSPAKSFQAGGGIGIQLFNSFYLLVLTMIISIPISLGAGIWLSEYAKKNWLTDVIRTSIEILSSLPSVVVGLFGFILFVLEFNLGFSLLSGALALTIFSLPLLTTNVENALQSIHFTQREAGLALGLSRIETVWKIVIPAALPNILTGIILASGRVFGEAAALIYTAGQSAPRLNFGNWNIFDLSSPLSPFRPAETLAVHIWKVNSEGLVPDAALVSAGASAVLVLTVLIFNFAARYLGNRLYQRMTGGQN